MPIIKCKMCGGDLKLIDGESVAECEYCGTRQTVPTADSEKKLTLFGRAGRLLRACEFDKAAGVFESIVAEFPEEAEAYWGLVLCKYGIEYVDDPATGRKIPTCHRSSFESVLDDDNFDQACENADPVARRLYREEAKAIEELRRGIIEVSGKEAPYDIFICYKETDDNGNRTLDSVLAQDIYDALTERGYRVFFSRVSLEDKLGQEYEPYIFAALNSAKLMLAVGTDYDYYNAVWVKNEWSRFLHLIAAGQKKTLIPCYKNIDAYDMPKEFAKLQAQDLGKVGAMQDLLRGVDKIMGKGQAQQPKAAQVEQQGTGSPSAASLCDRGMMFLEDGEWAKADEYFEKVLDIDPRYARAYFGKLLAERKAANTEELIKQAKPIADDPLFEKTLRYAEKAYQSELISIKDTVDALVKEENEYRQRQLRHIFEGAKAAKNCIALGSDTVGVRLDGTVMAVGDDTYHQCDVSNWTDIVAVASGEYHTVGVRNDGTVVAVGSNLDRQCKVSDWMGIVSVAAGNLHTVGLRRNGTVVAVGYNKYGQCDVSDWRDIVAVAAGNYHTVALRSDGTVIATGYNEDGQFDVSGWKDILDVAAGRYHTVGLRRDGTVVAVGNNYNGQCNVSDWINIIAVAAGNDCTVGLRSDGTVVAVGNNRMDQCNVSGWTDIIAVATNGKETIGLKSDGTLVSTLKDDSAAVLAGWKLFNNVDTLEQERKEARAKYRQGRTTSLNQEKAALHTELSNLQGLFSGKRRKEIEARLSEIEQELKRLK